MQRTTRFFSIMLCLAALSCSDDSGPSGQDASINDGTQKDLGPRPEAGTDAAPADGTSPDTGVTTAGGSYVYISLDGKLTALSLGDCSTKVMYTFAPQDLPARARISPDGKWLSAYIKLYELPSGAEYLTKNIKINFPHFIDGGKKAFYIDYTTKDAIIMDLASKTEKTIHSDCRSVSASLAGQLTCYVKTTSKNTVKFIDQAGAVKQTLELGQFKQYTNQSPRLPPDGKRLVWGEADSKNNITIFAMELATKKKVKVAEELGATGTHIMLSWDSKAAAFASTIGSVVSGKQICKLDLNKIRKGCGFMK